MTVADALPPRIVEFLRGSLRGSFATVSRQGVPIDTPMIYFPEDDLSAINVGTGLAYPAKAERARRNPKVGLLPEGGRNDPVVLICGRAAVRDADIQRSTDRYLSETAFMRTGLEPWPNAKLAVWYWARMIVSIAPVRIMWWDSPSQMDREPRFWEAPAGTVFPQSDPAPRAEPSAPLANVVTPWRELATVPMTLKLPGHLTLCDDEGYPLPVRMRDIVQTDEGFTMNLPGRAPWKPDGKATLSFYGREIFVGEVSASGDEVRLAVERSLPINPFVADERELWHPGPETRAVMMGRLEHELARRGQSIPIIPDEEPFPTSLCGRMRQKRMTGPTQGLPKVD
jgi:hypothetical protein